MKCIKAIALILLTESAQGHTSRRTKNSKGTKNSKAKAACSRSVWSAVDTNLAWEGGATTHDYHPQVWYHTLEDIHSLWKDKYFDYVLDIRPLEDLTVDNDGTPLLLQGWETFHIPGSYPINVFPPDIPAAEVKMLVDFNSSNVCKDSRIFVHCWSGISGNMVAKTLIELGFTNVHAAGPAGSAGMWDWMKAGYEVTENDTYKPMVAKCMNTCSMA